MKKLFLIFSILLLIVLLITGINQKINASRSSSAHNEIKTTMEDQILRDL